MATIDLSGYKPWRTGLTSEQATALAPASDAGQFLAGSSNQIPAKIIVRTVGNIGGTNYMTYDVYINDGTGGPGLGILTEIEEEEEE